jgi:ribosomal protein S6--L-glutamate ligase
MHIHFLTRRPEKRSEHALVYTAKNAGHIVSVLDVGLFALSTQEDNILYSGTPWTPVDMVYPFWSKRDSFLPLLLRSMHNAGQKLYKPIQIEIPTKLSAAVLFRSAGLPTPKTIASSTIEGIYPLLQNERMPLILKIASSAQGQGVFLFHDRDLLIEQISALCTQGIDYVVQECIQPMGKDVRAFVINNRVFASMERTAPEGEFRANIALGGIGKKTELSQEETDLVCRACSLFSLPMAGVDFMRTPQGPVLLEVNREPGYKGITEATKKDVAMAVILDFTRVIQQNHNAQPLS